MLKISHQKASTARGCWKKYYWRYEEHLKPITKPISMTLGAVVHDAYDLLYKGETDANVLRYIGKTFDEEISKVSLPDQEDLVVAKYTALGMWTYNPYKIEKFEALESEESFEVRLGNMRKVRFVGRIDGRVKKKGVWWVREVKTTGFSMGQFEKRIQTSAQATGYVYSARQQGYPVEGVMFDYLKRALLHKKVTETANDFGKRIYLDYKTRPKFYFNRCYTYRNPVSLKLYEQDTIGLVKDMRAREKAGVWYRNPDHCWYFNSECPYKKICFQEVPDSLTVQLYYDKTKP